MRHCPGAFARGGVLRVGRRGAWSGACTLATQRRACGGAAARHAPAPSRTGISAAAWTLSEAYQPQARGECAGVCAAVGRACGASAARRQRVVCDEAGCACVACALVAQGPYGPVDVGGPNFGSGPNAFWPGTGSYSTFGLYANSNAEVCVFMRVYVS